MPNPFCHVELHSIDLQKSKEFYSNLFDWKLEELDANHSYITIRVGEGTGGGMMKLPTPGTSSAWLGYICVDDIIASTAKAKSLGARLLLDVSEAQGYGRFSVSAFSLILRARSSQCSNRSRVNSFKQTAW